MHALKLTILFWIFSGFVNQSFSQNAKIQWIKASVEDESLLDYFSISSTNNVVFSSKKVKKIKTFYFNLYENDKLSFQKEIYKTNIKGSPFEGAYDQEEISFSTLGDHFVLFITEYDNGNLTTKIKIVDKEGNTVEDTKTLDKHATNTSVNKLSIDCLTSNNSKYLAIVLFNGSFNYYYCFNESNEITNQGKINVQIENFTNIKAFVKDNGQLNLIGCSQTYEKVKTENDVKLEIKFDDFYLVECNGDQTTQHKFGVDVQPISYDFKFINEKLYLSGISKENNTRGIFSLKYNLASHKIEYLNSINDDKVIVSSNDLTNYKIIGNSISENGDVFTVIEYRTFSNTQNGFLIKNKNILVYKFSSNGEFEWSKQILKDELSNMDYISSCLFTTTNEDLIFIFNDNLKNYDENGKFNKTTEIYPTKFGRSGVISITKINKENGNIDRSILTKDTGGDFEIFLYPGISKVDEANDKVFLFSKTTFQYIGILNLN